MVAMNGHYHKQKGLALVEMTLILPFLLLLLLGGIEYGWLFLRSQQITNTARQGARAACVRGASPGAVDALIKQLMISAGMSTYNHTWLINGLDPSTVNLRITVPTSSVAIVNAPGFLPIPVNLGASVTMVIEGG